jgi:uncharacterized protein
VIVETNIKSAAPIRRKSERTCIACKLSRSRDSLARFVRTPDGEVVFDPKRNYPGRGANICFSSKCIQTACDRQLFARSFKNKIKQPNSKEMLAQLRKTAQRRLTSLVGSAAGARYTTIGAELTAKTIAAGTARCVLLANDSARRDQIISISESAQIPVVTIENKVLLGTLLGRKATGVASISNIGLSESIIGMFNRLDILT